jgi:hypothetical protein
VRRPPTTPLLKPCVNNRKVNIFRNHQNSRFGKRIDPYEKSDVHFPLRNRVLIRDFGLLRQISNNFLNDLLKYLKYFPKIKRHLFSPLRPPIRCPWMCLLAMCNSVTYNSYKLFLKTAILLLNTWPFFQIDFSLYRHLKVWHVKRIFFELKKNSKREICTKL